MKRKVLIVLAAAAILSAGVLPAVHAQSGPIGLGIALGAAFPAGSSPEIPSTDWRGSFNWGFYVNIPLLYTFHLTPSAELYRLGLQNATDMAIAFKFIVPLSRFALYAGAVPGLTAVGEVTAAHVGVLAGGSFQLISNLDVFLQGKYKWLFQGEQNIRVLHLNAGLLFNF